MAKLYVVQGNYGQGWEDVTQEDNRPDALARLHEYETNENYPHRIVTRKE